MISNLTTNSINTAQVTDYIPPQWLPYLCSALCYTKTNAETKIKGHLLPYNMY